MITHITSDLGNSTDSDESDKEEIGVKLVFFRAKSISQFIIQNEKSWRIFLNYVYDVCDKVCVQIFYIPNIPFYNSNMPFTILILINTSLKLLNDQQATKCNCNMRCETGNQLNCFL